MSCREIGFHKTKLCRANQYKAPKALQMNFSFLSEPAQMYLYITFTQVNAEITPCCLCHCGRCKVSMACSLFKRKPAKATKLFFMVRALFTSQFTDTGLSCSCLLTQYHCLLTLQSRRQYVCHELGAFSPWGVWMSGSGDRVRLVDWPQAVLYLTRARVR